jgi:hypothetical protein
MKSCDICLHRGVCFLKRKVDTEFLSFRWFWTDLERLREEMSWHEFLAGRCRKYAALQDNAGSETENDKAG